MMAEKPPLTLKDYLELDSCSESSSKGFRFPPRWADPNAATDRCLLEAELRQGVGRLIRSRSWNALAKISAVINAGKLLEFSSSSAAGGQKEGFLSRTFSKKLKGSFWKKRTHQQIQHEEVEEKRVRVKDIVRLRSFEEYGQRRSFDLSSPIVTSCSSLSELECSESDLLPSFIASSVNLEEIAVMAITAGCDGKKASPTRSPNPNPNPRGRKVANEHSDESAAGDEAQKKIKKKIGMESPQCHSEEGEREQLSPVSVMDFPSEEEDEEELSEDMATTTGSPGSSSSFHQSFAKIERTKLQLLQKIRRFESLAELDHVDLDQRFSAYCDCDDLPESGDHHGLTAPSDLDLQGNSEERRAWGLLGELKASVSLAGVAPAQVCIEKLLLDFFIQGLSCSDEDGVNHDRSLLRRRKKLTSRNPHGEPVEDEPELLNAAIDWVKGTCYWDDQIEFHGEKTIMEMAKNGRWGCLDEEEDELGVELGGVILRSMLEELVSDLASSC